MKKGIAIFFATGVALSAGQAGAQNTVRLRVEDHVGNATEQQFDINVTAGPDANATWIRVPATTLPGTGISVPSFSVMKYEARGNYPPISTPSGAPAKGAVPEVLDSYCQRIGPGYNLISETQWLAIAHNVTGVAKNWTGGAVGSGYLMRGAPYGRLAASIDDADGYMGVSGVENRRTLALSNGEVIWDFAGNVGETTYCDAGRTGCAANGRIEDNYLTGLNVWQDANPANAANADVFPTGYTSSAHHIGMMQPYSSGTFLLRSAWGGSGVPVDARGVFMIAETVSSPGFRCVGP